MQSNLHKLTRITFGQSLGQFSCTLLVQRWTFARHVFQDLYRFAREWFTILARWTLNSFEESRYGGKIDDQEGRVPDEGNEGIDDSRGNSFQSREKLLLKKWDPVVRFCISIRMGGKAART